MTHHLVFYNSEIQRILLVPTGNTRVEAKTPGLFLKCDISLLEVWARLEPDEFWESKSFYQIFWVPNGGLCCGKWPLCHILPFFPVTGWKGRGGREPAFYSVAIPGFRQFCLLSPSVARPKYCESEQLQSIDDAKIKRSPETEGEGCTSMKNNNRQVS